MSLYEDMYCNYCGNKFKSIALTLPCAYLICREHLFSGTDKINCMICNDHEINIKECLNMPGNKIKIKKNELELRKRELNEKIEEFKKIKKEPKNFVQQSFKDIFLKIDLRREEIKKELERKVDEYCKRLEEKVKDDQEKCEKSLQENINSINLNDIEKKFGIPSELETNKTNQQKGIKLNSIEEKVKDIEMAIEKLSSLKNVLDKAKKYESFIENEVLNRDNVFATLKLNPNKLANKTIKLCDKNSTAYITSSLDEHNVNVVLATNQSKINLQERINYLNQAIQALNNSQKPSILDELSYLNDKKEIAILQQNIYNELNKIEPITETIQESLNLLNTELFDITKLYYDFAEKYHLYQSQLTIFKMAKNDDSKTIDILWKQIIANEFDKLSKPEIKPAEFKFRLSENIINIAKQYVDDEKYFPLATLIDSLEFVSLLRGFEPEWACNLFRALNIPFDQLIKAYDNVYLKKDGQKWTENAFRFINAFYCLIESFIKSPSSSNDSEKIFVLKLIKDLIPKYITELTNLYEDEELCKDLINQFKSLYFLAGNV